MVSSDLTMIFGEKIVFWIERVGISLSLLNRSSFPLCSAVVVSAFVDANLFRLITFLKSSRLKSLDFDLGFCIERTGMVFMCLYHMRIAHYRAIGAAQLLVSSFIMLHKGARKLNLIKEEDLPIILRYICKTLFEDLQTIRSYIFTTPLEEKNSHPCPIREQLVIKENVGQRSEDEKAENEENLEGEQEMLSEEDWKTVQEEFDEQLEICSENSFCLDKEKPEEDQESICGGRYRGLNDYWEKGSQCICHRDFINMGHEYEEKYRVLEEEKDDLLSKLRTKNETTKKLRNMLGKYSDQVARMEDEKAELMTKLNYCVYSLGNYMEIDKNFVEAQREWDEERQMTLEKFSQVTSTYEDYIKQLQEEMKKQQNMVVQLKRKCQILEQDLEFLTFD